MIYEILKDGQVINTITAQNEFMLQNFEHGTYRALDIPEVKNLMPEPMRVTRLAFLHRLTDAEAIALDIASQGTSILAASLRRFQQKVNAAPYIDLALEETISGVNALEQMGIIAQGRAAQILTAPVQPNEIPRGI